MRSQSKILSDVTKDDDGDEQHHKPEVQSDRPQVQGRDDLADGLQRGVRRRVDDLESRRDQALRTPAACQDHHPVDDEAGEQQHEEDEQDRGDDLPEEGHGPRSFGAPLVPLSQVLATPQDWLRNPPSRIRALSSAVTSTSLGLRRNTLFVTRSILPRSPKMRPAAKSTSRLASASDSSVRFMMTAPPSRKRSPIWRASL